MTHQSNNNVRAISAQCLFAIVDKGRSLGDELPKAQALVATKDAGLLQELCYGVLRYLPQLEWQVSQLMEKPLKGKQRVAHFLLLVGTYQFLYTRIPDHATVAETVAGCSILRQKHLKGLVNAILRTMQREMASLTQLPNIEAITYNHPSWFIEKLKQHYPKQWQSILVANQQKPPMWLRVNTLKTTPVDYRAKLQQANIDCDEPHPINGAIRLHHPIDVNLLPEFHAGLVSIQDGAAQFAAQLLDCKAGDKVLDCCAAPGGKTCHILERTPLIASMTALDVEQNRLARVQENLTRLQLSATLIANDAAKPELWWNNTLFDRILLDAPCSGTGVIRRHPDIKWLRKAKDIDTLVQLQRQIFTAIWALLKPGGTLVYATCSVLAEENSEQIAWAKSQFTDLTVDNIDISPDATEHWQLLPDEKNMDGFFYAKLRKINTL